MGESSRPCALVTGARGGLGAVAAQLLCRRGWKVFGADLRGADGTPPSGSEDVIGLAMDVTDAASVDAVRRRLEGEVDGLDGVVNLAGVLEVGAMVEMDEALLRKVMDVNVMGTWRVNRALFPMLRERRGRIINMSSETGWQSGAPFNGAYAMSKHAMEAYSDSLRRELQLLGMHVVKLQPGPFRTGMVDGMPQQFQEVARTTTWFAPFAARMAELAVSAAGRPADPARVAEVIWRVLTARRPRAAYSIAPDLRRSLLEWLPTRVQDAAYRMVLGRGSDRG